MRQWTSMTLLQIVALVLAALCLVFAGVSLIEGELGSAALGVFLAANSVVINFRLWPSKGRWRKRSS